MKLLHELWYDGVVPFWKQVGELHGCSNGFLHRVGRFAASFVDSPNNVHGCAKARSRARFSHQLDDMLQGIKQHARAGSAQVRKKATLDQIVFGTIARIVSHANRHVRLIGNRLKIVFEKILTGRVTAAAIEQQQHRTRIGKGLLANAIPILLNTVAGKLRRVVRQAKVHMPTIANRIVNAVRNQHAFG